MNKRANYLTISARYARLTEVKQAERKLLMPSDTKLYYHPECAVDEVFFYNVTTINKDTLEIPERHRNNPNVRLGNIAYDIDGKKLDPNYARPVIVKRSAMEIAHKADDEWNRQHRKALIKKYGY